MIFLLALTIGASYLIARVGPNFAFLVILGAISLVVGVFMIAYPVFGFYMTIGCSFFIFVFLRLFNTQLPLVSAIDLMVYITFIGVVIRKGISKESFWKHCRHPIVFIYLVIILFNISEFFNPNGGSSELYFLIMRRFLSLILFLYTAIQLFEDLDDIKRFYRIMLILGLIAALYACFEEWFGMPRFELAYIQSDPLRNNLAMLDDGSYRKSSFFSSSTDFGLTMAGMVGMLLVFLLKWKKNARRSRVLLTVMVLMALAMTYSGTRTATLMLVVEIVLYTLMTINERKTIIFSSVFALGLAMILIMPSYGNGTIRRLKSTFDFKSEESLQVRDVNRHHIQPYIYTHPIGGGIGTTGVAFYQYNIGHPLAGFPTDSGLLNIVLETGWIGLIVQCLSYFIFLQQGVYGYYKSRNREHKVLLLSAVICIFGYVFAQYAQIAIGQLPGGFLFLGLNAAIVRLRQLEEKGAPEPAISKSIK